MLHGWGEGNAYKKEAHLEDLDVHETVILKWLFKKTIL